MRRGRSIVCLMLAICGACLMAFAGIAIASAKPSLSYGKAQAEAQKATSAECSADANCQYWAASCARVSPAAFSCIDSTWVAGIEAGLWIRCDSELIVKATRIGVQTKGVLGSSQCYSTLN